MDGRRSLEHLRIGTPRQWWLQLGEHVLLAPPFIVGEDEIGAIVDRLAAAIDAVV